MKRYFKRGADSALGEGVVYLEFDGEWATRQLEIYGNRWFRSSSEQDYHEELGIGLCDQPLSNLELNSTFEISKDEFEAVWFDDSNSQSS